MKGHNPPTQNGQVAPPAPEFPLWGNETHEVLIKVQFSHTLTKEEAPWFLLTERDDVGVWTQ